MKVLICIPCLLTGGTEIQTLNLIQALVQGSHQVTTVCYFKYSDIMIEKYQQSGSKVICLSRSGQRINRFKGILFLYKGLRKTIKECKPDVAHVQYMAPGAIPILLLRLLGIHQIIATTHTAADIYPNLKLVHFIQKYCVRAFTCITLTAEKSFFRDTNLYSSAYKLQKRNHFTIYNALPSSIAIRKDKRPTLGRIITLGVVSRLEKIKGMDLLIPAFAQVKELYPQTRLLVIGDGSLWESMKQKTEQLNVIDVTWAGRQSQEHLQEMYDQIDILLMPSRSEGFGLTAIEGMARGCVVVASNTGGLPEVVKNNEVGLLHQTESVEDMVNKITLLLNNPILQKQLSDKAIEYVHQYNQDRFADSFNDLYKRIL